MGGLFSSENEITAGSANRRRIKGRQRSKPNCQLFGISNNDSVVTYTQLAKDEYSKIEGMITNRRFKVDSIIKISNPYLEKAYELKKEQKQQQYPHVEERLLFHGTKHTNEKNIFEKNFDWRRCERHRYGKGVSFSPNAMYASHYSDQNVHEKVMIVAKVLIGKSCIGNASMDLPDKGCDTSQRGEDGIVIVKYEDNEFYPAYKILYHLANESVGGAVDYDLDDDYDYQ